MENKKGINFENDELKVRLVEDNEKPIETSLGEAKKRAEELNLDLIHITTTDMPIVKIGDYNKYMYEKNKKLKEMQKPKKDNIKEIRVNAGIAQHDIEIRAKQIDDFLLHNMRVMITIKYKGRMARYIKETGNETVNSMLSALKTGYKIEKAIGISNNRVTITIAPKKGK